MNDVHLEKVLTDKAIAALEAGKHARANSMFVSQEIIDQEDEVVRDLAEFTFSDSPLTLVELKLKNGMPLNGYEMLLSKQIVGANSAAN